MHLIGNLMMMMKMMITQLDKARISLKFSYERLNHHFWFKILVDVVILIDVLCVCVCVQCIQKIESKKQTKKFIKFIKFILNHGFFSPSTAAIAARIRSRLSVE